MARKNIKLPPIRLFIGTRQVTKAELSEYLKKSNPTSNAKKKV